jgi:tetratricopeptide (TPR) repeat protein
VPRISLNYSPRPRPRLFRLVTVCLAACSLAAAPAADTAATAASAPQPETRPPAHLTDAQDRLGTGRLNPAADARSQANALYAEALLLPDGPAADRDQAMDLFRRIIALDPSFADARVKLADLLLQSGQFDLALAQLQTAAAAHPDSLPIEVDLGYALRLRGQNDEARRLCTRALTRDPTLSLAIRVLLEIADDQDDLAGGVLHVEDILQAGGSHVPASSWLDLARLYIEIADADKAPPPNDVILKTRLPILQQAAAKSPPDPEALTLLAVTYRDLDRKADALKTFRRAVALNPDDIDSLLSCASLESDLGHIADAIRDDEKVSALSPDLPNLPGILASLYLKLALSQLEQNEVKPAGQTLASAQTRFPQSAQIRFYQAVQHRCEKNDDAALASLAQALALATPSQADAINLDYYRQTAAILNITGQKTALEALLREALDRYPDSPEWMNELAYFWADQGRNLPEALALSRRAAALDPANGPIIDTCGWVYFQMGRPKDALPYLQRAALMTNNDPVVLQHVGDACSKLGLTREAIAAWSRALEKDPRNGDLANRIDAAQAQAKNAHLRSAPNP